MIRIRATALLKLMHLWPLLFSSIRLLSEAVVTLPSALQGMLWSQCLHPRVIQSGV
jgi:hypothetical protein